MTGHDEVERLVAAIHLCDNGGHLSPECWRR